MFPSVSLLTGFDCIFLAKTPHYLFKIVLFYCLSFLSSTGGEGSKGGKGRLCMTSLKGLYNTVCSNFGLGPKAPDGARGDNGPPGRSKLAPLPYFIFDHCLV